MSDDFFSDLNIPKPDYFLGVGSGSHALQTAKIMIEFERICIENKPELVIVPGDVNSTLACAIVASKLHIPIAHIESGLRSFDKKMPEEINRIITDSISDLLFVTEKSGIDNLLKEGVDSSKIHFVGNTMIDSLTKYLDKAIKIKTWEQFGFSKGEYCLLTIHRPSNVDDSNRLKKIFELINYFSKDINFILPIHPRLKSSMDSLKIKNSPNLIFVDPLPYIRFLSLLYGSKMIITDSGGIQEESSYLNVPCITLRSNTERPVTVDLGTNYMTGLQEELIINTFKKINSGKAKISKKIKYWDGNASERIYDILKEYKI